MAFQRLVAKSLARQFGKEVEAACSPHQFALSTRTGTDCVGHVIRALTDANLSLTVTSIDGVGAYDHVYRSAMLSKLVCCHSPGLCMLKPPVTCGKTRKACDITSDRPKVATRRPTHAFVVQLGRPQLTCRKGSGSWVLANICWRIWMTRTFLSLPERARPLYDVMGGLLETRAGIQLHAGKTRIWNRARIRPDDIDDLGEEVWSPVGSEAFVQAFTETRLEEERRLWNAIPSVPDLQCAWQLLLQCAGPRCHHVLRTVPPSQSERYAAGHDAGMQQTMVALLGGLPGDQGQMTTAFNLSSLPMRLGGLGLRSARRLAPAACWASWADAMPMLQERVPDATEVLARELARMPVEGCLGELHTACGILDRQCVVNRPSWEELLAGARPTPPLVAEPREWQHGWQYYTSSASDHHFRETVVLAQSHASDQAHLRSHSGPGAGAVLHDAPTGPEFQVQPILFRTLILERLRLPLLLTEAMCECGGQNDLLGRHRAACPRSGRLKRRAVPTEITMARICREAGATVRRNVKLRDMNVHVAATDEREVEVVAAGLPIHHGAQLAADITLRSATSSCGAPRPNAAVVNGAVLTQARRDKEVKYSELVPAERCRLVVIALETGGRWSTEALNFVEDMANSRAREAPPRLRRSAFLAWRKRWTRMLSVSCARSFATSLVTGQQDVMAGVDGSTPDLADLFGSV